MSNRAAPVIEVRSLAVRYGRSSVVDGVSFQVDPGDVYALLGRNGAGKSSLVRCLLGHQKPSTGAVELFGRDVWKHRAAVMTRIGVVPEVGDAPPAMSVLELSRFFSRLYPRWDAAGLRRRLERFEVPLRRPFGKLSKGQRGQVMLALALAGGPELLVLDDPTLGLDMVARKSVFEELVTELADRAVTVLVTSHDLPGIESVASREAFLHRGRLRLDEDLETLKSRYRKLHLGPIRGGAESGPAHEALQAMKPLTLERGGRDLVAVVRRFDGERFDAVRGAPGIERAEAFALSLEEILIAAADAGEESP